MNVVRTTWTKDEERQRENPKTVFPCVVTSQLCTFALRSVRRTENLLITACLRAQRSTVRKRHESVIYKGRKEGDSKRIEKDPTVDDEVRDATMAGRSKVINPTAEDLSTIEFETSEEVNVVPTFDQMNLREELLRGIYSYGVLGVSTALFSPSSHCNPAGFEKPSAIQQRAIRCVIKGRDVIAQAQSGTGKTATFCIGALQSLDTQMRDTQVLVLSPTRELAQQIQKVRFVLLCLGVKMIRHAGDARIGRLYERPMSRMHRWYEYRRGYPQIGLWTTYCERHTRQSVWFVALLLGLMGLAVFCVCVYRHDSPP